MFFFFMERDTHHQTERDMTDETIRRAIQETARNLAEHGHMGKGIAQPDVTGDMPDLEPQDGGGPTWTIEITTPEGIALEVTVREPDWAREARRDAK